MKHSIIIGVLNHLEDCTRPCIESILEHTDLADCEVLVVANGCTDGTEAYIQSLGPPFRLLSYPEPLGFPKAYNEGMKAAKGKYITLLNNDTVLLPQSKGEWLRMLEQPFLDDPDTGLTGPFMANSPAANESFLIFFCVTVSRECVGRVGYLDEIFTMGTGEDTDFCVRAKRAGFTIHQAPAKELTITSAGGVPFGVGEFPIYHKGHKTLEGVEGFNAVFVRNNEILANRYNNQYLLGNQYERAVFTKDDEMKPEVHGREIARYEYARAQMTGSRVLEIGCSTGFAKRFLPPGIDYLGMDRDQKVIDAASRDYGDTNYKFVCGDINTLDWSALGRFDTIIAFEVLEHLHRGREVAQELKEHCDTLLCTTPYKELPGMLGPWHRLHQLTERDFPGFEYNFILEDGVITASPNPDQNLNLMLMKWQKGKTYAVPYRVLACVSTKDRYDILPLCIHSIAMQTLRPAKLVIFDDGEQKDLREHPIYKPMFHMLRSKGIEWEVIFGPRKGQHWNHQHANTMGYEFVWRIDDDEFAEPDVLAKLMSHFTSEVGAVGGAVFEPGAAQRGGTGKLEDVYSGPNVQWAPGTQVLEVEHLYSSFVYRAGIVQYDLSLSPVAHREETIFSHMLCNKGYKLLVDSSARTYHYRQPAGGIRAHASEFFYDHDEAIFAQHMERWGIKLVALTGGLGDNFAFLNILPGLKRRYKTVIIGTANPEVFSGQGVKLIPMPDAVRWCKDNVYGWMASNEWKSSIVEAFAKMYGVEIDTHQPLRAKAA